MTDTQFSNTVVNVVDTLNHSNEDGGEDVLPLLPSSDDAAEPNTRLLYRTRYLGAFLGILGILFAIPAFGNHGISPNHSEAPHEFDARRVQSHLGKLTHVRDVVQLSKVSNNTKIQGLDERVDVAYKVLKDDKALGHVPPSMHLVHRDFSKKCGPPLFQCISERIGPTPSLQKGSALIKVRASAVNHDDPSEESWYRQYYSNVTLGLDASGTVVAVAEDCGRLKVGDHVWSTFPMLTSEFYGSGGLAEYATVLCSCTGIAPSSIDLALAGTLPTDALTSLGALQAGGAPWTSADFTVMIAAGTGGTGYSAVQLAKAFGATKVVTAAGREDGVNFVQSLGADVAVDYHTSSIFDAVPDGSVNLFFDNLGVDMDKALKKLKSPGGIFIGIVQQIPSKQPRCGIQQKFYYVWSDDQLPTLAGKLDMLANLINTNKFKVVVDQTYELDHIKDAYNRLFQGNLKARIGVNIESGRVEVKSS